MPEKKHIVPRLRFPEFRNAGPWEVRTLEDLSERITQGGTPDTSVPDYWNGEIAWITPAEMGDDAAHHYTEKTLRTITPSGLSNSSAVLLPVNSVIISSRAPIGYVTINKVPMATNQGCKGIVPKRGIYYEFLYFSLLHAKPRLNDLGAGAGFKEISASTLKAFSIAVPNYHEQQKIADCLSSLDEVIELEAKKLEALKAHKRGLLQQLFPREGETTPRLRFPEFRDAGPWEVKRLGEVAEIIKVRIGDRDAVLLSVTAGVGLVPQVEKFGREIAGNQKRNYFAIRKNDFAYNKSSTKDYPQGYIGLYKGDKLAAVPNSIFTCFRPSQTDIVPAYLDYLFAANFHGKWLQRFVTIGARAHGSLNIDDSDLLEMPLPIPSSTTGLAEQQKIADCLSSLDEVIELETRKLEALKAHKKGLMQQLFPQEVTP